MKSKYLSAAAALLCAAGLAACGGSGNANMALGAQVYGLDRSGLVLQNNGGDDLEVSPAQTVWFFKTLLSPDAAFNVTIKAQPSGVTCKIANNTGKINYYSYQQTVVTCTPVQYALGGTVVGLTGSGLVLANGALTVGVVPGAGNTFEFNAKINNGAVYGVTVLAQPVGQTCTVANGVGTMPQANVSNVVVTCQ
ncbi:hypothetical protein [Pseudoduganella sp. OTU4001]|uniref:hypothetical protein n=1 Tax=Pseudoduganella sp. OTU4001 TaxID=3043854 RepID=UPI00313B2CF5